LMYMAHIIVLYRQFIDDKSLSIIFGGKLNAWECLLASLLLIGVMIIVAKIWSGIKQRSINFSRVISFAVAAVWIGLLITREY